MEKLWQLNTFLVEKRIFLFALLLLPILFLFGIRTKEVALVLSFLVAASLLCRESETFPSSKLFTQGVSLLCGLLVVLTGVHLYLKIFLGEHGVDFAIFSQVIRSASEGLGLRSTIVAAEPVDFLSHHFSPYLYLLGGITALGLPSSVVLIGAQVGSLGALSAILYLYARACNLSKSSSLILLLVFLCNPTVRGAVLWGVHDEILAAPFLALGVYGIRRGDGRIASLGFLLPLFFKETFFLVALVALPPLLFFRGREIQKGYLLSLPLLASALLSYWYWGVRPEALGSSFSLSSRIASVEQLLSGALLLDKGWYLFTLLLPFLFLPFLSRSGVLVSLLAFPFVGASLVTGFEEMFKPFNYYGFLPSVLFALASLETLNARRFRFAPIRSAFLSLCFAFALYGGPRPLKTVSKFIEDEIFLIPDSLEYIPRHSYVLAGDFDLLYVLDKWQVARLWTAEHVSLPYTHIIVRLGNEASLGSKFKEETTLCFQNLSWSIFCRQEREKERSS